MLPYDGPLRYRLDIFRRSTSSGMKSNVPKNARPSLATCRLGRVRGRDTPIAGWVLMIETAIYKWMIFPGTPVSGNATYNIYIYIYYIIYNIYMYMYTFDHSTISWAPTNSGFSVSVGEFHVFFFAVYGGDIEGSR